MAFQNLLAPALLLATTRDDSTSPGALSASSSESSSSDGSDSSFRFASDGSDSPLNSPTLGHSHSFSASYFPTSSQPNSPEFAQSPATFAYRTAASVHAAFPASHVLVVDEKMDRKMQLQGMRDSTGNKAASDGREVAYGHVRFGSASGETNFDVFVFEAGRFSTTEELMRSAFHGRRPYGYSSASCSKVGRFLFFDQVLPTSISSHNM